MVFSSPLFLFLFLPLVLAGYGLVPGIRGRNLWLLLASLVFYAWGEVAFIVLLLASTAANYGLGRWVDREQAPPRRKIAVAVAVAVNLGLLGFFKYADFVVVTVNGLLIATGAAPLRVPNVPLPIGISFFTFHALSYVIDVYRRKWPAARDPRDVALYIFFFPQLIAGPILRWSGIAPQLARRKVRPDQFAEGIRRFAGGMAKKVVIANAVAVPADQIFALGSEGLSASVAWFGVVCYSLQIYFDFSGYSDMAVGLGKMFGFEFIENFDFPYVAQSMRDFWRRWHISLSTWFRDYLYIPMGGNRGSEIRTGFNLITVFFLCGLWHGASWTFVAWGLYHGVFLVLERTPAGAWLERLPRVFRHAYAVLIFMLGWVLFRADSFSRAWAYFGALFELSTGSEAQPLARYASLEVIWAVAAGVLFSAPLWGWLKTRGSRLVRGRSAALSTALEAGGVALETGLVVFLLVVCAARLAGGTYNPFIYFRF